MKDAQLIEMCKEEKGQNKAKPKMHRTKTNVARLAQLDASLASIVLELLFLVHSI